MTSEENRFPRGGHPDGETLDLYRCGLLDDDPALAARLREHLAACPECTSQNARWQSLRASLERSVPQAPAHELAARREAVLFGTGNGTAHGTRMPLLAVAASALLALAGAGLFLAPGESLLNGEGNGVSQQAAVEDEAQMYSEIEFYIWMSENPDVRIETPNDQS